MAKIGRNEQCPCRSGKKYKRCCGMKRSIPTRELSQAEALKITLMSEVEKVQEKAKQKIEACWELGVFFFYSTQNGDAWLLEMTDCDGVQVARGGEVLEPPIDENAETIEINWSHTYAINNKQVQLTAYEDKSEEILHDAPGKEINAAMRRIRKKFSKEQLGKVHVSEESELASS